MTASADCTASATSVTLAPPADFAALRDGTPVFGQDESGL
jgi:hypothetical protein